MSLDLCIPGMIDRGELTQAQADRMRSRYDQLLKHYRRQMGEAAAKAEASVRTLDQLASEAFERRRQSLLQVAAWQNAEAAMNSFDGAAKGRWRDAAIALFDRNWAGKASYQNVEELRRSLTGQAHAMLEGVLETHHRGFATGAVRNKAALHELGAEAFGEASGNAAAKALADAWGQTSEWLRQRFNAAGGSIGKREKWGFPQNHHAAAVRRAADDMPEYKALEAELKAARNAGDTARAETIGERMVDMASRAWRDFITPLLDRAEMIDRETGLPFSDEALQEALDGTFRNVRTEGWEGRSLGVAAMKKLANRHADPRFLIFKDFASWNGYHERFGTGTLFDVMVSHVERMSRDIAHLEILGPNPTATVRKLNDFVEAKRQTAPDSKSKGQRPEGRLLSIDKIYDQTSGALAAPVDPDFARRMGSVRSTLVAAQLGSATLSALTDVGWQSLARIHRGLPVTTQALDLAKMFSKTERRESVRTGLIADEASRLLAAQNRYVGDEVVGTKSAWLAERVLNFSLLSPWTQAGKWSFGRAMQSTLGAHADRPLEQVPAAFQRMLREYGFDGPAWDRLRAAPLDSHGFLNPMAIADAKLRDRALGMILTETDAAIPAANATARAMVSFGQPGTFWGEASRSMVQYKSFGVALILMQGGRMMATKGMGNKLAYFAAVNGIGTSLGLLILWLRDIRSGEDPRPVDEGAIAQSWLQGVGFGVFGDFVAATTNPRASSMAEAVAGPTVGAASDAGRFVIGNAAETVGWMQETGTNRDGTPKSWNEQTHAGREFSKLAKRYTPGTNLWYARLGAERLFFDQMQMLLDPEYEASWKALDREMAKEGREYYWARGETAPDRAPQMPGSEGAQPGL